MAMTAGKLTGVLEEAVHGLTELDGDRLEKLERELTAEMAHGGESLFAGRDAKKDDALKAVVATHRLLGSLLQSTHMNLSVLEGLRRRNDGGDGRWGR